MRLVYPSVEIVNAMPYEDMLALVERAGRICTQTTDKAGDLTSAEQFVKARMDQAHYSILEHVNITVRFVTNRKAMAELTRHRISSYSVESTRFCNYSKNKFDGVSYIFPVWRWGGCKEIMDDAIYCTDTGRIKFKELFSQNNQKMHMNPKNPTQDQKEFIAWLRCNILNELCYSRVLEASGSVDLASEQLNSAVKTEMLVTKNVRMWMDFFMKRIGKRVYPGASYLASELLSQMGAAYPIFFNRKVFVMSV